MGVGTLPHGGFSTNDKTMVLFKDVKEGQTIYLFNRNNAEYMEGVVSTVPTAPHYVPNQAVLMTDVSIRLEDSEKVYSIPENLSLTYAGDWCLATAQQDLLREIELLDAKAEKTINDVPRLEHIREKCKKLKLDLNPQLKAQMDNEKRFEKIEKNMEDISSMFKEFMRTQRTNV